MAFSRQDCWGGLPCPSLGDLPDPGIKAAYLMSPALAGRFFTTSAIWEALYRKGRCQKKRKGLAEDLIIAPVSGPAKAE